MQKRETLAQLIRRTVLEFEQRQAAQLLIESSLEDEPIPNPSLSKNKSQPKHSNRKKRTA
jgi:hypothetical protein